MNTKNMSLTELLVALDETNKEIRKLQNDPAYIQKKVDAIDWSPLEASKEKALSEISELLKTF